MMSAETFRIWTARLLLGFVLVTIGFAIWRRAVPAPVVEAAPELTTTADTSAPQIIVYAAHMTFRCPECNQIEWFARELIENEYAEDLAAGRLDFRTVDYMRDQAFARTYNIASSTIVVVRMENDRELDFQRLDEVWTKVNDREAYFEYVRAAIENRLESEPEPTGWFWLAILTALWFGILTSISPCPLATNIAAISFVARHTGRLHSVLLAGILYTVGRTIAYIALGALIMAGLLASGEIAWFFQRYLNLLLGPALLLIAALLLGLLRATASVHLVGSGIQHRAEKGGWLWPILLGILFALSFCPVSAGLFFGVLIPLSVSHGSIVTLPLVYGIGTAAPVAVFALLIAFASQKLGSAFDRLTHVERWVRRITGGIFIIAGLYYSLVYVYELPIRLW